MVTIKPFSALRPQPELAARICELPYDVLSSEEARQAAASNPLSFFHVSKPEIDLPHGTDLYAPEVYAKGKANFDVLISHGALHQDPQRWFYLYRQKMGAHSQTGLVAVASCQDYLDGVIKKHELTRPDKEDDRVRHIETLGAQTGPVFLVYRANAAMDGLIRTRTAQPPQVDFTASDNVRHTAWVLSEPSDHELIEREFRQMPSLYIADGHHRCAAAACVFRSRGGEGESGSFLSVIFPHNQVQILPYNRVLKDLNNLSAAQLLERLQSVFIVEADGRKTPAKKHEIAFYVDGQWRSLNFRPGLTSSSDPVENLDATLLQKNILGPVFGIDDPRTSKRIQFVGGIRGVAELEKLVDTRRAGCAFSMFPTSIEDLMMVADAGGIMPPKSTWFEPKLRDAMFCHLL